LELLARIRAVLRRSRQPTGHAQVLQHGPLTVDLRTHKVSVNGNQIAVTPKEFAILECLASDPGRVVSRQEMLERAWDEHWRAWTLSPSPGRRVRPEMPSRTPPCSS
jgi:DNA-binding response OmpR family regulator